MRTLTFLFLFVFLGCGAPSPSPGVFKRPPEEKRKVLPLVVVPTPAPSMPSEEEPRTGTVASSPAPEAPPVTMPAAKDLAIVSKEQLAKTPYRVLERITVRDVSQAGFSREEAREALQHEAFRRFGEKAKGIADIEYQEENSVIPGTIHYSRASGDVITW